MIIFFVEIIDVVLVNILGVRFMEQSNDISALKDLGSVLLRRIEVLESPNVALRAENTELLSRLNLNSKNSHKPPSSDGLRF
jgi:hypothetical protein